MELTKKVQTIIEKATKKKDFVQFTVGILKNDEMTFKMYDHTGEIPYKAHMYEVGSTGKVMTTSLLAKPLSISP